MTGEAWTFDAVFQLALKAAAVGRSLGGAAVLYGFWDRFATGRKARLEAERQEERDEADDGKQLCAELRGDLTQMRRWLADEMAAHQVTMKDRDRGWNLARRWNRKAFAMRHAALNARHAAEGLAHKLGLPAPDWQNDTNLPDEIEDPISRD